MTDLPRDPTAHSLPPQSSRVIRPCYACEGLGCEECDHTGQRVCTLIEDPDGPILRVHGSAPLTRKDEKALRAVMKAALRAVEGK